MNIGKGKKLLSCIVAVVVVFSMSISTNFAWAETEDTSNENVNTCIVRTAAEMYEAAANTSISNIVLANNITGFTKDKPINVKGTKVLDLKGYNLTTDGVTNSAGTDKIIVESDAELTIADSSEDKEGTVGYYAGGTSPRGITVKGTLILNSGNIVVAAPAGYAVQGVYIDQVGSFEMNGGTVKVVKDGSTSPNKYSMAVNVCGENAKLDFNDGTISVVMGNAISASRAGSLVNMRGGTAMVTDTTSQRAVIDSGMNAKTMTISGGTVKATSPEKKAVSASQNVGIEISGGDFVGTIYAITPAKTKITGGHFATPPIDTYLGEGYSTLRNDEEKYDVLPSDSEAINSCVASCGKVCYKSIATAILEVANGGTVKVLKNIDAEITQGDTAAIAVEKNLTIDGNGKIITALYNGDKTSIPEKGLGQVVGIQNGANVVIKNLTIDGNSVAEYGVQASNKEDNTQSHVSLASSVIKNCKSYGVKLNGAKVEAARVTVENNSLGGVSVMEKTNGIAPSFVFNSGTLQETNAIQAEKEDKSKPSGSWVSFGEGAGNWYATSSKTEDGTNIIKWSNKEADIEAQIAGGAAYSTFKEALEEAVDGDTVKLLKDIEVEMGTEEDGVAIDIAKNITIEGNDKTITAIKTGEAAKGKGKIIGINGATVNIKNLTIDGNEGVAKHGIQSYESTGTSSVGTAILSKVTVKECAGYGVVIIGAVASATDLTTKDNTAGGVNLLRASDESNEPEFNFISGNLNENNPIQIGETVNVKVDNGWVAFSETAGDWHSIKNEDETIINFEPGKAIEKIELNQGTASIKKNSSQQLIAKISPTNAYNTDVTWTSSNEALVTVSDKGVITSSASTGTATITATAKDGKTATCTVTVGGTGLIQNATTIVPFAITNEEGNKTIIDENDVVDTIENVKESGVVVVQIPTNVTEKIIGAAVFEKLKKSEAKEIVIETPGKVEGDSTIEYPATFTIKSEEITKAVDVNLVVKPEVVEDQVKDQLPEGATVIGLDLSHNGAFPATTTVGVKVGTTLAKVGATFYMYHVNGTNLEPIKGGTISALTGGVLSMGIPHASSYVASSKQLLPENVADQIELKIGDIGKVRYTEACDKAIGETRNLYDAFVDQYSGATSLIRNIQVLIAAESEYAALDVSVQRVNKSLEDLGSIGSSLTYKQTKAVKEIQSAYGELNADQKLAVDKGTYGSRYADALAALASYDRTVAETDASVVIDAVEQLPANITYNSQVKQLIDNARYLYDEVTTENPATINILVAEKKAIENAETEYLAAKAAAEEKAAQKVKTAVAEIPAVITYDENVKKIIDEAKDLYDQTIATEPGTEKLLAAEKEIIEKAEKDYLVAKVKAYDGANIKLTATKYTYNGKAKDPNVEGLDLFAEGTDYIIGYKNNIKTGKATVIVTGKGDCKNGKAKTATFKIIPKKAKISKLVKGEKSFKIVVESQKSAGVTGYRVYYSTKKTEGFKGVTTTSVTKTIKKLKGNKTYYVKVRAYKNIDKKNYYGEYSSVKSIKTKK